MRETRRAIAESVAPTLAETDSRYVRAPREHLIMRLYGRAVVFTALLFIGLVASATAPDAVANLDFFSTSAQVVPVLMLVLAVEARILSLPGVAATAEDVKLLGRRDAARLTLLTGAAVVLTLGLLLWAEYAAFDALSSGKASDGDPRAVVRGLAVGFGAVALLALASPRPPVTASSSSEKKRDAP